MNEELIEKKVKELITMVADLYPHEGSPCVIPKSKARDFIRTIVEDCKPKINKAFIGKVSARIYCDRKSSKAIKTHVREAFEEMGLEVE